MKWQKSLFSSFFMATLLLACSDSDKTDPLPSSTQAASNTAPATAMLKSDAKQKRSDASAQRLQAKVQTMTETVHSDDKTQKFRVKQVFKYDKNGNRLELSEYSAEGKLNSTIKSIYDSSGKIVSDETVLSTGEVAFKSVIRTDENGNKVEEVIKQTKGNNPLADRKYLYKYDEKANMLEWYAVKGNGGFFFKYSFHYDANGNRTEWLRLNQTNILIGKTDYKYDDKNNIIEEAKYGGDGTLQDLFTYTYEYDKKGNWVKQKKMQDGTLVEIRKREFTYF